MEVKIKNSILGVIKGDITEMAADAIVNAANEELKHGGGVAGAIVKRGGRVIQEESDKIGHCKTGEAVITKGGKLKANYVIHAVGPVWRGGNKNEDEKLKSASLNALKLAEKYKLKSIVLPAISAGIFGFPIEKCARTMLETAIEYLKGKARMEKIIFCLLTKENLEVFKKELKNQINKVTT